MSQLVEHETVKPFQTTEKITNFPEKSRGCISWLVKDISSGELRIGTKKASRNSTLEIYIFPNDLPNTDIRLSTAYNC